MDDLISRQAAIDAILGMFLNIAYSEKNIAWSMALDKIRQLPTAGKRGEWIPVVDGHYILWECSECHVESEAWTDFCPICGSRNIEEMDEDGGER